MIKELLELQEKIDAARVDYVYYIPKVTFFKTGNLYDLTFYGEGLDEHEGIKAEDFENSEEGEMDYPFCAFLDFVIEHADKIRSLEFIFPQYAEVRDWDFTRVINSNVIFENLQIFSLPLGLLEDGNGYTVSLYALLSEKGLDYVEDGSDYGIIAKLVTKMPNLEELTIPVTPNEDFFQIKDLKIKTLKVQSAHIYTNFLKSLSNSDNLKELQVLDYECHFSVYEDEENRYSTPFEEYKLLFQSKTISFNYAIFRDSNLTKKQLLELRETNPNLKFRHIATKVEEYH